MLSSENASIFKKRFKSFLWRLGAYIVVALLNFGVSNLGLINLSPEVVAVIALIVGEITKYINVNLKELKKVAENN